MDNCDNVFDRGMSPEAHTTQSFRLLGFLPLFFFLAQAIHYWRISELGHMLWMCNIGNLLLALGLFLNRTLLTRVAVIWLIPGLVIWFLYVALTWGLVVSSTLAHVGGIVVGLMVLKKVRMDRVAWLYALGWYLVIQLISRLITPAAMNVNVSHTIDPGWQQTFGSYWQFWLVLTILTAFILWIIGVVLHKIWPEEPV
jgi:hypothetical protein